MRNACKFLALFLLATLLPVSSPALPRAKKTKTPATSSIYDEYLAHVRSMNVPQPGTPGSLWVDSGPLSLIAADYKARHPGDLVIIHLADNFTAATNGENKQSRQFA